MEYSLTSIPVVVSIGTLLIVFISWLLLWPQEKKSGSVRFPPGSTGLPLIGDTITFIRALASDNLKSVWDKKIAKYGPIFKMSVLGGTVVVMDPPAGIKFFFINENKLFITYWAKPFARLLGPDSVANKLYDEHRLCRRHIVSTFLGPDIVWRFVAKVETIALQHLQNYWQEDVEICSYNLMKELTFGLICELSMGVTDKKEIDELCHVFEPWVAGLMQLPINLPGFKYHAAVQARIGLHRIMDKLIVRRRQELKEGSVSPNQDLLSALLTHPDEKGHMYTDNEIKDNIQFMLAAGHETSSSVLTLTIRNIAKYPHVYKAVIEEQSRIAAKKEGNFKLTAEDVKSMEYTWRVVQETMRVTPVVNIGMRIATEDFQYKGFTILKGWKILWSQDRCSKESIFFDNPDKFDPPRFERSTPAPYTYLPFGAGPRACPGNEFAKMEILVFLHHLLRNYKWSLVDPNEPMVRKFVPMTKRGSLLKVTKVNVF